MCNMAGYQVRWIGRKRRFLVLPGRCGRHGTGCSKAMEDLTIAFVMEYNWLFPNFELKISHSPLLLWSLVFASFLFDIGIINF